MSDFETLLHQVEERDKMQRSAVARALRLLAKETPPRLPAAFKLALRYGGLSRMDFAKLTKQSISTVSLMEKGAVVPHSDAWAADAIRTIADRIDADRPVDARPIERLRVDREATITGRTRSDEPATRANRYGRLKERRG